MEIKIYAPEGWENAQIRELIKLVIVEAASRINLPIENIATVALALDGQYALAVSELFDTGFSNTEAFVGVAKAKTDFLDGSPTHTLLFKDFVFNLILLGFSESPHIADWPPDLQMGLYIISHELGHCKDATLRNRPSIATKLTLPNGFDLDRIHDYYFSIFIDELFACFNGDALYNIEHFQYQAMQDYDSLSQILSEVLHVRNNTQDPDQVYQVAVNAAGLVWSFVIQYGKLWAGKHGTSFEGEAIPSILNFEYADATAINSLNKFLDMMLKHYPELPDEHFQLFIPIWNSISLSIGYKFVKSHQGWGCYWNLSQKH